MDIWGYYKFLKIQAFELTDTLFVILTIPFIDQSLTFCLYKIYNLPLLHPILKKSFQYEIFHKYFAIKPDMWYITLPDDELYHIYRSLLYIRYCVTSSR